MKNKNGFTLVEVMVVVGILAVVVVGMLQLFVAISVQSGMAGNKTLAVSEAQTKLEEIHKHNFNSITVDYAMGGTPGNTFVPSMLKGSGAIEITAINSELIEIGVKVCWEDKYNRIVGEDTNLNGVLDVGEDKDADGILDCPVTLKSKITRR